MVEGHAKAAPFVFCYYIEAVISRFQGSYLAVHIFEVFQRTAQL